MKRSFLHTAGAFFARRRPVLACILTAAALLGGAAAIGAAAQFADALSAAGVTLEGEPAGGLTETEVRTAAERMAAARTAGRTIPLRLGSETLTLDLAGAGLSCDTEAAVRAVMACGHAGTPFERLRARRQAAAGAYDVPLRYVWDAEALRRTAADAAASVNRGFRPASFTVTEDAVALDAGQSGLRVDADGLAEALAARLAAGDFSELAWSVTVEPVTLPTVEELAAAADREPADAAFDLSDPLRRTVTEERSGRKLDRAQAAQVLAAARDGGVYTIRCFRLEPSVTRKLLEGKLYRDTLASSATQLNPANTDRTNNVRIAAGKLDGTLVGAGETFSFNETVGPRTYGAGYRDAVVFRDGEKVDDVGGGVCQVSTTLYMAALRAGMETVERSNHAFAVSYAPLGEDAAVYRDSVDLKFRNVTDWPLRIGSTLDGGTLTVTLTGTDEHPERTRTTETEILSVTEPGDKEEADESLAPGERRQLSAGQKGYTTRTWRVTLENGQEIGRTLENRSVYQKEDRRWAVGLPAAAGRPDWLA